MIKICVAVDTSGGFAKNNNIPWNIPEDFSHFMKTTKGSYCITGRQSYQEMAKIKQERMGDKYDPNAPILSNRDTYVVTSTLSNLTDATAVTSLSSTIDLLVAKQDKDIFILGGEQMFVEAFPVVDEVIMTVVDEFYDCDRLFPLQYLTKYFKLVEGTPLDTKEHGQLKILKYVRVLRG